MAVDANGDPMAAIFPTAFTQLATAASAAPRSEFRHLSGGRLSRSTIHREPRLRSGLFFWAGADGGVNSGRAGQFPLKAEKSPLLRVDDVGQSVIALRSAKKPLLFEDGTQTVADRGLETTKVAQPAI